jgi:hypothetical protein
MATVERLVRARAENRLAPASLSRPGLGRARAETACANMDSVRSPIWVGWLVWTLYGPDREASLITQRHHWSSTAVRVGYGPWSESGRPVGRTERTARIGADIAASAPLLLGRLSVIVSCDWVYTYPANIMPLLQRALSKLRRLLPLSPN